MVGLHKKKRNQKMEMKKKRDKNNRLLPLLYRIQQKKKGKVMVKKQNLNLWMLMSRHNYKIVKKVLRRPKFNKVKIINRKNFGINLTVMVKECLWIQMMESHCGISIISNMLVTWPLGCLLSKCHSCLILVPQLCTHYQLSVRRVALTIFPNLIRINLEHSKILPIKDRNNTMEQAMLLVVWVKIKYALLRIQIHASNINSWP